MTIMGKYDEFSINYKKLDETKILFLSFIANELAESNRLKRYELKQKLHDKPLGWYEDFEQDFDNIDPPIVELTDKA